eukprot:CAMPEP_0194537528 /NCGR_PEP_ID=MMETSP0253-20130528/76823_1 /TAXON_ID=2966 /ORGANISM="Noctiluca scintillans" /LENGTH=633 /DNA_ID=CAMNT_0039383559 /DNA_START=1 /DNA_END=1902 /DNA_ORIENTATION=+
MVAGDAVPVADAKEWQEKVDKVRDKVDASLIICVLGGREFLNPDSKALVETLAAEMAVKMPRSVAFVTGGMPGVQETFAKHCGDGARVWNLVPDGGTSQCAGQTIQAGRDLDERKEIFGRLGDIYVTVEGGPGVAMEARAAVARRACVIPLIRTGGASNGMFNFPQEALAKPAFMSEEQWALLSSTSAPVSESSSVAVSVALAVVTQLIGRAKAASLRATLDAQLLVCVLGSVTFSHAHSSALVVALAQTLERTLPPTTKFVTGGMDGVQKTFATNCTDGSRVLNLLPEGQSSGYGVGLDVHAGADLNERKVVFAQLGDVYVTVEGGPGVAQEARDASARGAIVVPMMRTGGASSGMFGFPAEALAVHPEASAQRWKLLQDTGASVTATAEAAAEIILAAAGARELRESQSAQMLARLAKSLTRGQKWRDRGRAASHGTFGEDAGDCGALLSRRSGHSFGSGMTDEPVVVVKVRVSEPHKAKNFPGEQAHLRSFHIFNIFLDLYEGGNLQQTVGVLHRYSSMHFLHLILQDHEQIILPARFPEKRQWRKMWVRPDISERRNLLEEYLNAIMANERATKSQFVRKFFCGHEAFQTFSSMSRFSALNRASRISNAASVIGASSEFSEWLLEAHPR